MNPPNGRGFTDWRAFNKQHADQQKTLTAQYATNIQEEIDLLKTVTGAPGWPLVRQLLLQAARAHHANALAADNPTVMARELGAEAAATRAANTPEDSITVRQAQLSKTTSG